MATSHENSESTITENKQENDNDDTSSSSDYQQVCTYSSMKKVVDQVLSKIETFVSEENFKNHIRPMAHNMENVKESLEMRRADLERTDCSIIIAGETSSGKSCIVNRLLGKKILPTDVTASTTRVCRIKYSEELVISTRDTNDMNELDRKTFQTNEDMGKILEELAQTNDHTIGYIDIFMPVSLLQGNVIIVDTPGVGDDEQNMVAGRMMEYIPNALAFVFVLNVSAAGGIQGDRIGRILNQVRHRQNEMVSFSPNDVIFVMNKWDTLCMETDLKKQRFTEKTKETLRNVWREVDDSCILKLSLVPTDENRDLFQKFQKTLKNIIAKNEQKRMEAHLRFLKHFLTECEEIVSSKLKCAEESTEENRINMNSVQRKLEGLENMRQEALSNLNEDIDAFLLDVENQFSEYIHQDTFKEEILRSVKTSSRFSIATDLDNQIEKATVEWQQNHIEEIFQRVIGRKLIQIFSSIPKRIGFIKSEMTGLKTKPDVDHKIVSIFARGGMLVGSIVLSRMHINPGIAGFAVFGLAATGLTMLKNMDDFQTLCEKTFISKRGALTKEISTAFQKRYAGLVESMIKKLLDGDLKKEIRNMENNVHSMQEKHKEFTSKTDLLQSLLDEVNEIKAHLNIIESIEINLD